MNLLDKVWINKKNVVITKKDDKLILKNDTNKIGFALCVKLFKKEGNLQSSFVGKIIKGEAAVLELLNRRKEILSETTLNSKMMIDHKFFKYFVATIKVFPNTTVEITKCSLEQNIDTKMEMYDDFQNDILVITPSYPSEEHKYLAGFVHSRVKKYKEENINVDVAVVYDYKNISKYEFEGIKVSRMSYYNLRELLQIKKYKKILVHFMDENYYNVLNGCNLTDTEVLTWVHGPETLYWESYKYNTKYFETATELTATEITKYKKTDSMIKDLNERPNFKFVFVSEWIKERSEELIGIKFKNYVIIPNIIDTDLFSYSKKTDKERHKIFMLRRFDNINKYAVDVAVRTIVELSKRKVFKSLEFNICGNGEVFDILFAPIRNFENVKFHRSFYTHEDIAKIHKENGIALFPTRYDAQGVSMCEAGSSGLLVVSSENDAIKEFIPSKDGNIIDTENYIEYANFIEKVVDDEKLFDKITKDTRKKIVEKCSSKATVEKEIELLKQKNKKRKINIDLSNHEEKPVLTIVIPSYNVAKYIEKTLLTLVENNENSRYLEILVVNDGSKDNTKEVVEGFINKYAVDGKNDIVKFIDKENGGHGSTINVGMEKARGKYFRVIDGDDWVKTEDLSKLIDILKKEETDIVLTDYSEDRFLDTASTLIKKELYNFMVEGVKYDFTQLCYKGYGFGQWGPVLATANIKTETLKKANFKLSEKTFYVDMEYNTYYIPYISDISYYKLDIYRYFIGRPNQSVSLNSFIRNIDQHQKVIFNIINFMNSHKMDELKQEYIYNKLLQPMIKSHYLLLLHNIKDVKKFNTFDSFLKKNLKAEQYKQYGKKVEIVRKTKGLMTKWMWR